MLGIAVVEDILKFDWCSFVLDWLVESIKKYQESSAKGSALGKKKISSLGGCLFVLVVTYFEYIKHTDILLPNVILRIKVWDDNIIQKYLKLNGNSDDGHPFGSLHVCTHFLIFFCFSVFQLYNFFILCIFLCIFYLFLAQVSK